MATDVEAGTEQGEMALSRPSLKIVGLHIKGLKSIGSLDLPGDGLGWDGPIPDFVMVGGINGSGKTTLLEFLAGSFAQMNYSAPIGKLVEMPPKLLASEARIDFWFGIPGLGLHPIRFLIGNKGFIRENSEETWFGFQYFGSGVSKEAHFVGEETNNLHSFLYYIRSRNYYNKEKQDFFNYEHGPAVVYFPSEHRTLISPETQYKFAGKLSDHVEFVYRWQPPDEWPDSLAARLYALRWEDLNAKEEGRGHESNGFEAYSRAFDRFFEGRKQLKWHRGELIVETKTGAIHDLSELSSGEKQVILFTGELLHRWRPGSIILIDEPELHLHESYQTKLWEALLDWQKERGGQVIVATQSAHLFGLSGLGTRVILSDRRSR